MENANPGFRLHNTEWQMVSMNDFMQGLVKVQDTEVYKLAFFENGKFEFETDCVFGEANFEATDVKITIEIDVGPEDTSCPNRTLQRLFFYGLASADNYKIDGNRLMIEDFGHRQLYFDQLEKQ